jgi:putative N-acetyltransferase (TIGR04045 family)
VSGASSPSTLAADRVASTVPLGAHGARAIACRLTASDRELEVHFELRRAVFVHEQALFADDDRDRRDRDPATLHALGLVDGVASGAVRLYEIDPRARLWKGDRLAVLPEHRANHLGAELVRFAVLTAGCLHGKRMIAHVQLPNVRFFEHLGWRAEGDPAPFHGATHQLMSIPLGGSGDQGAGAGPSICGS